MSPKALTIKKSFSNSQAILDQKGKIEKSKLKEKLPKIYNRKRGLDSSCSSSSFPSSSSILEIESLYIALTVLEVPT